MSVSDKEISHVSSGAGFCGVDGRNDAVDDEEDDDESYSGFNDGRKYEIDGDRKKHRRHGSDPFGKNIRRATQVLQLHFTKAKKKFSQTNIDKKDSSPSSSSGALSVTPRSSGTRSKSIFNRAGQLTNAQFKGCYFCFSQPQNLESPSGSQTSDPEGPNFTHALVRNFIEKNGFCSKECNPHLK